MRGVVVYGAHDDAARPGCDSIQRSALEFSSLIARVHVLHLAVLAIRDPRGENAQLGKVADRCNPAQIEARVAGALLYTD